MPERSDGLIETVSCSRPRVGKEMDSVTRNGRPLTIDVTIVSSNEQILDQCLESLARHGSGNGYRLRIQVCWNARGTGGAALPVAIQERYPQVEMIDNPMTGFEINQNLLTAEPVEA